MSRLTGTDTLNLMEAYQAVYAPKELTEEQVWEEVESWVNSLVEEGYDLSDYTWDEMTDIYMNEAREDEGLTPLQKIRRRNKRGNLVMQPGDQTRERRSYHVAGRGVKKSEDDNWSPGKNKWKQEAEIKKRYSPGEYEERKSQNIKAVKSQRKVGGEKGLPEQVELYDIIFSHLLDEGYATTEDGALAIMSNMSEDWIQSIIEDTTNVIRADVRDPRVRTNSITAGGRVPPGEQLIGNIMSRVGSALRGYNPRAIEVRRPAGPGKGSLVSRNVPKPTGGSGGSSGRASTNYGRGF